MASGSEFDPSKTGILLRASSAHVGSLRKLAEDNERILVELDDDETTLAIISALHLNWLIKKFETFWFISADTEAFVREHWPDLPLFSAIDFEFMTKHILRLIDDNTYLVTQSSHDQGIDLSREWQFDDLYNAVARTVVQCKLYRGYVPVSELRDFFGVMTAHVATGLFFTTGTLTPQGVRFVPLANESPHANRLHVVDEHDFRRLIGIVRELTELTLDSDVMDMDEAEKEEWIEKEDTLKRSGHKLIWGRKENPVQLKMF